MLRKLLSVVLIISFMLTSFNFNQAVFALSPPYLSLETSKDIITSDNAILHAKLLNFSHSMIKEIGIIVFKDNLEMSNYKETVNKNDNELFLSFDIQKDLALTLTPETTYKYTIFAYPENDSNPDMYKGSFSFKTSTVTLTATPTPTPTPTAPPTVPPTATPTAPPTATPRVVGDIWLLFSVDQSSITKNSTIISGSLDFYQNNSLITVKVNDKLIAKKNIQKDQTIFRIAVNFYKYKVGDKIIVKREYVGKIPENMGILPIHKELTLTAVKKVYKVKIQCSLYKYAFTNKTTVVNKKTVNNILILKINKRMVLTKLGVKNNFYKVRILNKTGYILMRNVSVN